VNSIGITNVLDGLAPIVFNPSITCSVMVFASISLWAAVLDVCQLGEVVDLAVEQPNTADARRRDLLSSDRQRGTGRFTKIQFARH
jgi:hypothetical protein